MEEIKDAEIVTPEVTEAPVAEEATPIETPTEETITPEISA